MNAADFDKLSETEKEHFFQCSECGQFGDKNPNNYNAAASAVRLSSVRASHRVRGPIERRDIGLVAINKGFTGEDCLAMRDDKKAATVVCET